jgi:hypothetical protein
VLKWADHSAVFAFNSRAVQLHTKLSSNQLWPSHQQRGNSWQLVTLDECPSLSAVFSGTSTFPKKPQLLHTKITMDVLQWVMHRNLPPGHAISISNTLHFVIGLNVISSALSELTHLSTSPTTSPNHSLGSYFTGTPITYLDISLRNIRRYINIPSRHTPTTKRIMIGTFLNRLRPP